MIFTIPVVAAISMDFLSSDSLYMELLLVSVDFKTYGFASHNVSNFDNSRCCVYRNLRAGDCLVKQLWGISPTVER